MDSAFLFPAIYLGLYQISDRRRNLFPSALGTSGGADDSVCVRALDEPPEKVSQKIVWLVFALCLVWWAGSCVYWRADWSQNGYSTRNPDLEEQMEICLILDALDGDKTVIADDDFLPLLRQVSGSIHLLYGSDIVEDGAYPDEIQDLHNKMTAGMFDSQYLLNTASDLGANYMIVAPDVNAPMPRLDELESNGEIQILYITEHYTLVKF